MIRSFVQLSRCYIVPGFYQSHKTVSASLQDCISKRFAGHSKWANIKHIKNLKDQNKSKAFQKICVRVHLAVKEAGDNPAFNWKLKALLEESKRVNMPSATFENAVKTAKASQTEKPSWLIYTGPKGLVAGFEVATSRVRHAEGKINQFSKKVFLKIEKHAAELCVEKGVILCEPLENTTNALDKAMEDAIELGIEEVMEDDDKMLIFECLPAKVDIAHKKLLDKGYKVQSATTELDFSHYISLSEEEKQSLNTMVDIAHKNYADLVRVTFNVEGL